ncbi:LysR family transcriptional regulator [Kurthia sibirica]|uniref:LysR family transcriptional regulator n=1 Tax=Kurthia sibirica TaxID=202750 RepID=A0A2U3AN71_9BACL|nr:LysR family transcriptional regulator [Kurthia sibirica]PWI25978.1 LysR family transcriptional regulator [Kurthia sibirica]GEK34989.1 putative HTH-type transcriptional regulator YwbI [Kurthia sibirica]
MDVKQLIYFTEVAKQQSFTKAATILHVTQPTLSKVVKQLENELKTILIDRSQRISVLTDAGEVVYEHALKIIQMVDEVHLVLDDLENLKKGQIKIGMPPLIGILFFPEIMLAFQKKYPDITITLDEIGANIVKERVFNGQLDGGFVMLPAHEEDFDLLPFTTETVQLIVHKEHPLAQRKSVTMHDLKEEKMLLFSDDFTLHDRILAECQHAGFEANIAFISSQWDFISQMVEHNLGIALFPQSIAKKANTQLINIIDVTPVIPWEISFITKKGRYKSHAMLKFLQFISNHYSTTASTL